MVATTEGRPHKQENQLPEQTNPPGGEDPWTRQEELQPRQSKWANKQSWRDNTPLRRVGDRGNPSPRGKMPPMYRVGPHPSDA